MLWVSWAHLTGSVVGSEFFFHRTCRKHFEYQPWFIQRHGQWESIEIETWKHHNQDIIVKLKGIDDRDAANILTNFEIVVSATQLPDLDGEYYWKDLMGCQVETDKGYD